MAFYVYILANKKNGTLYVGMTDDLVKRPWQHRNGLIDGFTKQHGVKMLVWFEPHPRTADREMESGLEARTHRKRKFRLA